MSPSPSCSNSNNLLVHVYATTPLGDKIIMSQMIGQATINLEYPTSHEVLVSFPGTGSAPATHPT
jgi:hypothetical protein